MAKAVVNIKTPDHGSLYALGDVHGCFDALIALENKIKKNMKRGGLKHLKIISVGDLCDRGPDTKKVLEHFVRGKEANTHELLLGNHEMFFLLAFIGIRPDLIEAAGVHLTWYHHALVQTYKSATKQVEIWRSNGGDAVFRSYDADISNPDTWDQVPSSHLRLLFSAPLVALTPKAIISHAILHEGDLETLLSCDDEILSIKEKKVSETIHRCLWERYFPYRRIDQNRRNISGHTPVEQVLRQSQIGIIQIDTGAVYGRKLTAINLANFRATSTTSDFLYRRIDRDL
jgi:serine/threonine protein phosphatase 1